MLKSVNFCYNAVVGSCKIYIFLNIKVKKTSKNLNEGDVHTKSKSDIT